MSLIDDEDREVIEQLLKEGRRINYIADQLRVSYSTMKREISRGGGVKNYNTEQSSIIRFPSMRELSDKINVIEMQLEILTTKIEELLNAKY